MERFRFEDVWTKKKPNELLEKLRKSNKNIVGLMIRYDKGYIEIDFENEPNDAEINNVKQFLGAKRHIKIKLEETEIL